MESMNYIAPNLYFSPCDELCFQASIPHRTSIIQDMLTVHPHMFVSTTQELCTVEPKRLGLGTGTGALTFNDADEYESCCSKKRKIIHRDVERQRRQEMSALYMSLRSLLPVEYLKGKRSISDHMNEAANYIKHLQKMIGELTEKRDRLRRAILSSSNSKSSHCEGSSSFPHVKVRTTLVGAAVVIAGQLGHEVPLSRVITTLVELGLNVISVSTCINAQRVYTLECESDDPRCIHLPGLQKKLTDSVCLNVKGN